VSLLEQDKIRQWLIRCRGELTHQQVAELTGISRSYYTEIESGEKNPSVPMAKKIAKALKFDWTLFFKDECRDTQPVQTGTDCS
jgi:transcriptional regulator with XRE-family HTH domain